MRKPFFPAMFHWLYEVVFGPLEPGMDREHKRWLDFFILESSAGTVGYTMTTGVFMTGYALYLGASDYLAGLLASVPMLMNGFQLLGAALCEKSKHKKGLLQGLLLGYRVPLGCTIFIPLLFPRSWWVPVFVGVYLLGFLCSALFQPGYNAWIVALTSPRTRGTFYAHREAAYQAVGMIFGMVVGVIVDALGQGYGAFFVPYCICLVFCLLNYLFIRPIRYPEPPAPPVELGDRSEAPAKVQPAEGEREPTERSKPKAAKTGTLQRVKRNPKVLQFAAIWILWNGGYWMAFAYFSVFMVSTLGLSYSFMNIINVVQMGSLVVAVRYWGRFGDHQGWVKSLTFTCMIIIVGFAIRGVVAPSMPWLLIPISIVAGAGMGGINVGTLNMIAYLAHPEDQSFCYALHTGVAGLAGFLGSVVGGSLTDLFANVYIGPFSGIQLMFFVSGLVMLSALLVFRVWSRRVPKPA